MTFIGATGSNIAKTLVQRSTLVLFDTVEEVDEMELVAA